MLPQLEYHAMAMPMPAWQASSCACGGQLLMKHNVLINIVRRSILESCALYMHAAECDGIQFGVRGYMRGVSGEACAQSQRLPAGDSCTLRCRPGYVDAGIASGTITCPANTEPNGATSVQPGFRCHGVCHAQIIWSLALDEQCTLFEQYDCKTAPASHLLANKTRTETHFAGFCAWK